jgi:peroxiredoxin
LRSFQRRLADLTARGVRVAAITVDSAEVNHQQCEKFGFTFPLLSDTNHAAVQAYGVLHRKGGPKGEDIARPAEFLVDSSGMVRWVNLTESVTVRARPEQVLQTVEGLSLGIPAK